jgi:hypothetical protein
LWAERQARFDARTFWNVRYSHAPANGAGEWSGGEAAEVQRALLLQAVAHDRPASVLDVGCGDMAVSGVLPAEGYLGLDFASAIVERNQRLFAERAFRCADFLDEDASADWLICLNVLPYVHQPDAYQRFVEKLVAATERVGFVSGFEHPPEAFADAVAYHEPLSETLMRAGAHSLQAVLRYPSGMTLWRYGVGSAPLAPMPLAPALPALHWRRAAPGDVTALQATLVQEKHRKHVLTETLAAMRASTSWRLTAPVRRLVTALRAGRRP